MKFRIIMLVLLNLAIQMVAEEQVAEEEAESTEEEPEAEGEHGEEEHGEEEKEHDDSDSSETLQKNVGKEVIENCNKQANLNFDKCVIWNHNVKYCVAEKKHYLHRCVPRQRKDKRKVVESNEYAKIAKNCNTQADINYNQCVIWNLSTKVCDSQRKGYLLTCIPRKKPEEPHEDTRTYHRSHPKNKKHRLRTIHTTKQHNHPINKILPTPTRQEKAISPQIEGPKMTIGPEIKIRTLGSTEIDSPQKEGSKTTKGPETTIQTLSSKEIDSPQKEGSKTTEGPEIKIRTLGSKEIDSPQKEGTKTTKDPDIKIQTMSSKEKDSSEKEGPTTTKDPQIEISTTDKQSIESTKSQNISTTETLLDETTKKTLSMTRIDITNPRPENFKSREAKNVNTNRPERQTSSETTSDPEKFRLRAKEGKRKSKDSDHNDKFSFLDDVEPSEELTLE